MSIVIDDRSTERYRQVVFRKEQSGVEVMLHQRLKPTEGMANITILSSVSDMGITKTDDLVELLHEAVQS